MRRSAELASQMMLRIWYIFWYQIEDNGLLDKYFDRVEGSELYLKARKNRMLEEIVPPSPPNTRLLRNAHRSPL